MTEELTRYDQISIILCSMVGLQLFPMRYESGLQKHCFPHPHCQGDDNLSQTRAVLGWRCPLRGWATTLLLMVDLRLKKVEQLLRYLTRSQVQGNPVAEPFQPFGSRVQCLLPMPWSFVIWQFLTSGSLIEKLHLNKLKREPSQYWNLDSLRGADNQVSLAPTSRRSSLSYE